MAFTGKKERGSRILTPETVENRGKFHKIMNDAKEVNESEYNILVKQMFGSMFEYLSHSAQNEFIEWARRAEWNLMTKGSISSL